LQLAKFGIKTVSVRSLPISMVQGHWPKPVTFAPGLTAPYPTTPNILPLQLLKIGMTVIAGIPAELTTMAGRRLRTAILGEMEEVGVTLCALATYANGYSQYITTKEEYDKQHYEGASVLFGPQTLAVYIEHYRQLTQQLQRGERIQTGLRPPYLFNTIPVLRRLTVRNLSASSISVSFFKQSSRLMLWSFAKTKIAPNRDQVIVLPRHIDQAKARLSNRQIIEQIRIHDLVTITIDGIAVISKYSPPAYPTSQDGVYPM
jgi:neutral ceramidase